MKTHIRSKTISCVLFLENYAQLNNIDFKSTFFSYSQTNKYYLERNTAEDCQVVIFENENSCLVNQHTYCWFRCQSMSGYYSFSQKDTFLNIKKFQRILDNYFNLGILPHKYKNNLG